MTAEYDDWAEGAARLIAPAAFEQKTWHTTADLRRFARHAAYVLVNAGWRPPKKLPEAPRGS